MKKDNIWLLNILNKLITKPEESTHLIEELQNTDSEIAGELHNISIVLQKYYTSKSFIESVVNQINEQILQYAQNNYFYKIKPTEKDDLLDSLISSLNMLGEEINFSTVSKEYFTDIFNTIPDFVIVVDEQGKIETANQNLLKELEESEKTISDFEFCSLFSEKYKLNQLLDSINEKKILNLRKKDNTVIPVTIKMANFIESDGQEIRRVFILSDVSEILKYQNELEQRNTEIIEINKKLKVALQKAEESDRLKSAFLANVSHEIRTPMNGILGFTDLLKDPNLKEDEKKEFLEIIEQSGNRMLETINDIIDISKIEAGQIHVNLSETKLNHQLSEIYNFFKPEAEQKGIQLLFQPAFPDNRDTIITDHKILDGIITNLVKNAIKFTEKGRIEFGYLVNDDTLEFFVKDTGIGISKNKQEIIFNRFIQEELGYARQFEGSGLGLSISKAYVDLLGGKIWIESEPGKGSQFYFTIPFKLVENPESSVEEEDVQNINTIKKINILVAEDEEVTYTYLLIVLKNYSKKFLRAVSGEEAVEILQKNPDIDLILMDIKMPKMDGYEATRKIRTFNKDVYIIAQTAYAFSDDKIKAFDAGCNNYLAKPINKEKLLSMISFLFKKQDAINTKQ